MTAQISDIVFHQGQEYALASCSGNDPFSPTEYGYSPVMAGTACWRGYLAAYEIKDGYLTLHQLHINHQEPGILESGLQKPPSLIGVEAEESDRSHIGHWVFNDVDLPLQYTGGLILAKGFIRSLYVHMGFHPPWKYEQVYELVFESGRLVSESDLSEQMALIRERMQNQAAADTDLK